MTDDIQDNFDKWCDQWDKAVEDGIFDDAPKPPKPDSSLSSLNFFGQYGNSDPDEEVKQVDADYWNQVYKMSGNSGDAPDPLDAADAVINEKKIPSDAEIAKMTRVAGAAPNRVRFSSLGKDQDIVPDSPDPKMIEQLADMKIHLEELESQLNSNEALVKATESFQAKIDSLRGKIDGLSDTMNNNRFSNALT